MVNIRAHFAVSANPRARRAPLGSLLALPTVAQIIRNDTTRRFHTRPNCSVGDQEAQDMKAYYLQPHLTPLYTPVVLSAKTAKGPLSNITPPTHWRKYFYSLTNLQLTAMQPYL
jgi:hypothetical protein